MILPELKINGLLLLLPGLTLCCGYAPVPIPGRPATLEIVTITDATLDDYGEITRAVKLETTDESALGDLSDLKIDPSNGDLLIADYRSTKKVYRFNKDGQFIRSYGGIGQGQGEYRQIFAFDVLDGGRIAVAAFFKILVFDREGQVLHSRENRWAIHWLESSQSRLYAYISGGMQPERYSILVFDESLDLVQEFHPPDPRLERITYIPYDALARHGDRLFVAEYYDLRITGYDLGGNAKESFTLPQSSNALDRFWQGKGELDDRETDFLINHLHHIRRIDAFANFLSIIEAHRERNLMQNLLLDLESNTLYRFEGLRLVEAPKAGPYLTFDRIVGAFEEGLIGTVEDPERLEKTKHRYPALGDITFEETDNPLIVFITVAPRRDATNRGSP